MTLYGLIFYVLGAIIVASTGLAITRRNQVHAVLYLVVSFFGTAVLFYLLGAPLLAALEVIIYAGAIMVLFLFIIMMLSLEKAGGGRLTRRRWLLPGGLGVVSLLVAAGLVLTDPETGRELRMAMASPRAFGSFLFNHYWLPVEIVSFLLFVGLVGALYLGRQDPGAGEAGLETEPIEDVRHDSAL